MRTDKLSTRELIHRIDGLLVKNRNSFTVTDICLLNDIKKLLIEYERNKSSKRSDNIELVSRILIKFVKFFGLLDKISELM